LQVIFERTGSENNWTVQFVLAGRNSSAVGKFIRIEYIDQSQGYSRTEGLTIPSTGNFEPLFTENMVGQYVRLHDTSNTAIWYAGMTVTSGMIVKSDGNYYSAQSAGKRIS